MFFLIDKIIFSYILVFLMPEFKKQNELEILYKQYSLSLKKFLSVICRNNETADDITQETFVRIHKSLETFDPAKGNFLTWARTIAKNLCIRHLNKKSSQYDYDTDKINREADQRTGHDEIFEQNSIQKIIKKAIHCLPEPERSIIYYKYKENLTLDQLAEKTGISRRTVSRKYIKAMELMKKDLGNQIPGFSHD